MAIYPSLSNLKWDNYEHCNEIVLDYMKQLKSVRMLFF